MDNNTSIDRPRKKKYQPNKYDTNPDECLVAFNRYCQHMADGYIRTNFSYRTDDFIISYKTLDSYMSLMPDIFPPEEFEHYAALGKLLWERKAEDCALAKLPHNTATLQMVMRNKCGWDKKEALEADVAHLKAAFNSFAIGREYLAELKAKLLASPAT